MAPAARSEAASDAGTAALLARAAVEGAVLNVLINLRSIEDEAFARSCRAEAGRLRAQAKQMCDEIMEKIDVNVAG